MRGEDHKLPDLLVEGLFAVICGTAAGARSAEIGNYYANSTNSFWSILAETGLTSRKLLPSEFSTLTQFGLGLTDLAKTVAGTDAGLPSESFRPCAFKASVYCLRPSLVAFNGKAAARIFYGISPRASLEYGLQPKITDFPDVFVLPSTSGSARRYWSVTPWLEFARMVEILRGNART